MSTVNRQPLILIILDGFGIAPPGRGNAITQARTPHLDEWYVRYPHTELSASGLAVGLPEGTQGTSEAGHITIGAGRIVHQPSVAIDRAIADESFFENAVLKKAMQRAVEHDKTLHLMGLLSDAGVHATNTHLYALMRFAKKEKVKRVALHLFLDGRDVPEKSARKYLDELSTCITDVGVGFVASMVGRYYAMDRDHNWDRTERAYKLLVSGEGHRVRSAEEGMELAYKRGDRSDYYVEPTVVTDGNGEPRACIGDGDVVIFYNFRSDRARQLTYAFTEEHFEGFARDVHPSALFVGMSTYDQAIAIPAAFPQQRVQNNLARVLSHNGIQQLRIAETEKYAHVTYFFNSQAEEPVRGENRRLVHSPKVPSYDTVPGMNARGVTAEILNALAKKELNFIVANFANPDLVGHSANLHATIQAIEIVDECLGEIQAAVLRAGSTMIIVGDHGNAESMIASDGTPNPSHTTNPVPCMIVGDAYRGRTLANGGGLKDIAPTVLDILEIEQPVEMTGKSLLR